MVDWLEGRLRNAINKELLAKKKISGILKCYFYF